MSLVIRFKPREKYWLYTVLCCTNDLYSLAEGTATFPLNPMQVSGIVSELDEGWLFSSQSWPLLGQQFLFLSRLPSLYLSTSLSVALLFSHTATQARTLVSSVWQGLHFSWGDVRLTVVSEVCHHRYGKRHIKNSREPVQMCGQMYETRVCDSEGKWECKEASQTLAFEC